jgi:hypothetical protein
VAGKGDWSSSEHGRAGGGDRRPPSSVGGPPLSTSGPGAVISVLL